MSTRVIGAKDIAEQLGISKAYAYKIIRKLNTELEIAGCLVIPGKVNAEFFEKRFFTIPEKQRRSEDKWQ